MNTLKNNRGLTLLEVLAVIAIGSIVSILVWSAFNSSVKTYHKTAEHINLRQEANILIETLSNLHKREEDIVISYNAQKKELEINGQLFNTKDYQIEASFNNSLFENPINNVNYKNDKVLRVKFKLLDRNGNAYDMQTTISRL